MPWWVWMILGVFFFSRLSRWNRRHHRFYRMNPWARGGWGLPVMAGRRHGCGAAERHREQAQARDQEVGAPPAPPAPVELSPKQKQEQAIADLRRRYVADDITVEVYERELDRLLREK